MEVANDPSTQHCRPTAFEKNWGLESGPSSRPCRGCTTPSATKTAQAGREKNPSLSSLRDFRDLTLQKGKKIGKRTEKRQRCRVKRDSLACLYWPSLNSGQFPTGTQKC